jgi:hypothetical protein
MGNSNGYSPVQSHDKLKVININQDSRDGFHLNHWEEKKKKELGPCKKERRENRKTFLEKGSLPVSVICFIPRPVLLSDQKDALP